MCKERHHVRSIKDVFMCNERHQLHPTPPHPNPVLRSIKDVFMCKERHHLRSIKDAFMCKERHQPHPTPPQPTPVLRSIKDVYMCKERHHLRSVKDVFMYKERHHLRSIKDVFTCKERHQTPTHPNPPHCDHRRTGIITGIYIEYILITYQTIYSNILHGCLLQRWLAGWVDGWIDGVTHAHSCSTYLDLHPGQEKNKSRGPRHLQKTYTVDKIRMYHPGIGPFKWCIPRNCKGQKPRIVKI